MFDIACAVNASNSREDAVRAIRNKAPATVFIFMLTRSGGIGCCKGGQVEFRTDIALYKNSAPNNRACAVQNKGYRILCKDHITWIRMQSSDPRSAIVVHTSASRD
jgi:hypothetical protein